MEPLKYSFLLIVTSFLTSFLMAPYIIDFLYKKKVVRQIKHDFATIIPEARKKLGTPIMGGLIFIISYFIIVLTAYLLKFELNWSVVIAVSLCFLAVAISGGVDDLLVIFGKTRSIRSVSKHIKLAKIHKDPLKRIYYWVTLPFNIFKNIWFALGSYPGNGIHAGEKILIQVTIFGAMAWWLYRYLGIDSIWLPFGILGGKIFLGIWIIPIFIFFMGFFSNGVNIADGMDGLSAGVVLTILFGALILGFLNTDIYAVKEAVFVSAVLIGGLLTYLYFNIKPARVQMGDVGSLALGVIIFLIFVLLDRVVVLFFMSAIIVAEIGSSVLQGVFRRLIGRRLFKMAPLHYHFEIVGWKEEKIVMRFWLFSILAVIVGLVIGLGT